MSLNFRAGSRGNYAPIPALPDDARLIAIKRSPVLGEILETRRKSVTTISNFKAEPITQRPRAGNCIRDQLRVTCPQLREGTISLKRIEVANLSKLNSGDPI